MSPTAAYPRGLELSAQGKESELALPSRNFLEHVMERYSRILEPKDWDSGQGPQSGSSGASKPGWAFWALGLLIRMQISRALRQNPCVGGRGGQPAAFLKGSSGASDEFYRLGRPGPAHTASHHRPGPELWLTPRTAGLSPLCHQAPPLPRLRSCIRDIFRVAHRQLWSVMTHALRQDGLCLPVTHGCGFSVCGWDVLSVPLGRECPSVGKKPAHPSVLQSSLLCAASDPNVLLVQHSAGS